MRALAGSIISAGSLIGLGFAMMGLGARYQNLAASAPHETGTITYLKWSQLDTSMMLIIVALLASLVAGLATTFVGLAYEHEYLCRDPRHGLDEGAATTVVR